MKWERYAILGTVLVGAMLRLPGLDLRAMHTDEAVHAVKFGALLESGEYRYDSNEYHGPTLNYITLIPAWLAGEKSLAEITELTLRIVPALFGIGLVLLILLLRGAGSPAIAMSAFLTACSPVMTYYSRYYIQETLLLFFTVGLVVCAYRFLLTRRLAWALAAGCCGGLMLATKETWLISAGAMAVSLAAVLLIRKREKAAPCTVNLRRVAAGAVAGIAVALLFYSSFFSHWEGVRDSLMAYPAYFARATEESRHGHPWYYFLRMLIWWQDGNGPVWSHAAIVALASIGIVTAFTANRADNGIGKDLRIFWGISACLLLLIASAIPYKTPWLILTGLQALIMMAGWGAARFLGWFPVRLKFLGIFLLVIVGGHLLWQSYLANFQLYDDPANPLAYAQPGDDVKQMASVVEDAVRAGQTNVPIQVIVSGDEYWPLPWYLRRLPRVGWWHAVGEDFAPTPLMLVSPDLEEDLVARLYGARRPGEQPLYVPLFTRPMYLRPGKEIRGYVTLDLWNRMRREG